MRYRQKLVNCVSACLMSRDILAEADGGAGVCWLQRPPGLARRGNLRCARSSLRISAKDVAGSFLEGTSAVPVDLILPRERANPSGRGRMCAPCVYMPTRVQTGERVV
jgi:hypothetical protein